MPRTEQFVANDKLISRTQNIILAQVVKAELKDDDRVLYTFKTVRRLKGQTSDTFALEGSNLSVGDLADFNSHFAPQFWMQARGRTSSFEDCEIHPAFSVRSIYLVFQDKPYHIRSFELITRSEGDHKTKDKCLQYVERSVASRITK